MIDIFKRLAVTAALGLLALTAAAQEMQIRLVTAFPENMAWSQAIMKWSERVNAQGKGLHLGLRLCGGRTVCEDTRQLRHLGEPPPVVLTVDVHSESHQMILLPPDWSPENTEISSEPPF